LKYLGIFGVIEKIPVFMQMKKAITFVFLLVSLSLSAQIGGETTYQFLSLTNSARVAALGGKQVAVNDSVDLNLPFYNPALLKTSMANQLLFNYVSYLAGIHIGYVSYAFSAGKYGTLSTGIHYINYGNFNEADETGLITGNQFRAGEYALHIIWSNHFKKWQYGFTLKPVYSVFESYHSFGIAGDAGIFRLSGNKLSSFGIVARNFGSQITAYYEGGEKEPIPFELLAGFSRKLAHAPIVISVTAQHLNNWKLAIPDEDENSGEFVMNPSEGLGKQFMRHILLGVELIPSPHFTIRTGYNYHLSQDMKIEKGVSTVGFSAGFGINVKRFRLDYSTTRYHIAGSSNLISLAINLNRNFGY
jgi:hypothetical protein